MDGTVVTAGVSHEALPYASERDFLSGALPFLRQGAETGDVVLAIGGRANLGMLRERLGGAAARVEFIEDVTFYHHPARTLAQCLAFADELAARGRRLRLLGEPIWHGRTPSEIADWQRIEAIVNVAFAGTGASILCPYDVRSLPPAILDGARRTHPVAVHDGEHRVNPAYLDPWAYTSIIDRRPLPPPPSFAESLRIDTEDLYWLRAYVAEYGRDAALMDSAMQHLLMSVTEVATNAIRHGTPPITLRLWTEPGDVTAGSRRDPATGMLVCEISDRGHWKPAPGLSLVPPGPSAPGRFGLWAVRLLCSRVQVRTGLTGTTIRLHMATAA
ncbi:anti-sigma factor RsbA family regulatory protein [Actinomadura scrupuli]|uniref:anti-sigma factor RsbA family regulatory protein n=1 Tax=Actinomadura scrupuli TaxID=559629 RepID=UPI003D99DEE7